MKLKNDVTKKLCNKLMDLSRMLRSDGYDEKALIYEQMADAIK